MLNNSEMELVRGFAERKFSNVQSMIDALPLDRETGFINFDFSKMYLSGVNFSGFNLEGANFENANLCEANFAEAKIKNANFTNSNLSNTIFNNAGFISKANFTNAFVGNESILPTDIFKKFNCHTFNSIIDYCPVSHILLVDDELKDIVKLRNAISREFPYMSMHTSESLQDAREKLNNYSYTFAIIDAKIPQRDFETADELLGKEISEGLINGEFEKHNEKLKHVIYTDHKPAVKVRDGSGHFLAGILEKDNVDKFRKLYHPLIHREYITSLFSS